MGNPQEQALGTENLRQNQALFRKYTPVDEALKNADRHSGGTSHLFPTVGPANRVQTVVRTHHASTPFLELRVDRRNGPRGKFCEDDGSLLLRGTPCLIGGTIVKGV